MNTQIFDRIIDKAISNPFESMRYVKKDATIASKENIKKASGANVPKELHLPAPDEIIAMRKRAIYLRSQYKTGVKGKLEIPLKKNSM